MAAPRDRSHGVDGQIKFHEGATSGDSRVGHLPIRALVGIGAGAGGGGGGGGGSGGGPGGGGIVVAAGGECAVRAANPDGMSRAPYTYRSLFLNGPPGSQGYKLREPNFRLPQRMPISLWGLGGPIGLQRGTCRYKGSSTTNQIHHGNQCGRQSSSICPECTNKEPNSNLSKITAC